VLRLLSKNAIKKLARNPLRAIGKGKDKILVQIAASSLRGYSPFPKNLTFFMTYRCNLRCNVCGQWGTNGYVKNFSKEQLRDEVDIDTLKRVIDEILPHRPNITMCGGEVLLYDDWFEFMSYVKEKDLDCVLTTNAMLLEQNAEKLVDIGLDKLSVSLDGPKEIHNSARAVKNAFESATCGIARVHELKASKNKDKPALEIGCTISDQNYKHLKDIVDIAESLNAECLIFLHLAFLSDDEFERHSTLFRDIFQTESFQWAGYRYKPKDLDVEYLADKIEEIKSDRRKMPVIFHPDFTRQEIRDYYTNSSFLSTSYCNVCMAPWTTAYILPNGDVSPCSSYVAGNVRTDSLKKIWNNQKFKRFRTELKKRKLFPVCPRCCELYKH
jgi:MoaA/NifB/PqqE/SkfB family radical SAM enzyme